MDVSPYWAARLRWEDEQAERDETKVVPFPARPEPAELVELVEEAA